MSDNDIKIWDECFAELSEDGQRKAQLFLDYVMKCAQKHEKNYNNANPQNDIDAFGRVRGVRMGLGEASAKELIIALLRTGNL